MTFSLLHSSARPHKWREIYDAWLSAAHVPSLVEYVLIGDERWGFDKYNEGLSLRPQDKYTLLNPARRCYVEGVNLAAKLSTGRLLIVIADDQYPMPGWDDILAHYNADAEFVYRANTGTRGEIERGLTVMPIVTRARYERLGYIFYPGYESMYADNDITEHAQQDGVLVDLDPAFLFPHRHPSFTDGVKTDEQYAAQNRQEAYDLGAQLLNLRRESGFGSKKPSPKPAAQRQTIAVCLPGETFSSIWVSHWTGLFVNLFTRFNVIPIFVFCSNVHVTRGTLWKQIQELPQTPDYILWIDDDNPVNWDHVARLIQDLEDVPTAGMVAGWCWIHDVANGRYLASCGLLDEDYVCRNFTAEVFRGAPANLIEAQFTGFPLVLMRGNCIEKMHRLYNYPFAPLRCDEHPWGFLSEDTAFCARAPSADIDIYVDRRVKVDHLKLGPLGPPSYLDYITPARQILPAAETPAERKEEIAIS